MDKLFEFFYYFFCCYFRDNSIVASTFDFSEEAPEEVGCCSFEENMGLLLRANLLFLALACLEAIDPISFIFGVSIMFTSLKGLAIFTRPSIPHEYFSFFDSLTFFGVTVKLFMSNSYCEISEMESAVRTLSDGYSPPISISFD